MEFLPGHIFIKWLMLFLPLLPLLAWHVYQHRSCEPYRSPDPDSPFEALLEIARWRGVQVAGIWLVAVALIAHGDIRYYRLLAELEEQTPQTATAAERNDPSDTADSAENSGEANAPENAALNTTETDPEAQLDQLKSRYEDAFISYFYLQRCARADVADLAVLNESLAEAVASLGDDHSDLHYAIFSAAQGSYEAIYADTPCEPGYVEPVVRQFEAFMQGIR